MDDKHLLYEQAKNSDNASLYLRKNTTLEQSKIIEISYDIQSGNYSELENSKYFCDVYDYFSKKICNFIDKVSNTNYNILEIGCGEGNLFYRICKNQHNKYNKSFGLDISISRLMHSKMICEKHRISNYSLIACDMKKLPLKDNSIDFIITCHAIEPNGGCEEEILKELYRVSNKYLLLIEPQDMFSEEQQKRMKKNNYIGNLIDICKKLNYDIIHIEDNQLFFNNLNRSKFIIIKKNEITSNNCEFVSPGTHNKLYSHMNHNYDENTNIIYPKINDIDIFTSEILCNNFLSFN